MCANFLSSLHFIFSRKTDEFPFHLSLSLSFSLFLSLSNLVHFYVLVYFQIFFSTYSIIRRHGAEQRVASPRFVSLATFRKKPFHKNVTKLSLFFFFFFFLSSHILVQKILTALRSKVDKIFFSGKSIFNVLT